MTQRQRSDKACFRHARYYAHLLHTLDITYSSHAASHIDVMAVFNHEQDQIDHAWLQINQLPPTPEGDEILIKFGLGWQSFGDLVYDKHTTRIHHYTTMLAATQRQERKHDEVIALAMLADTVTDISDFSQARAWYDQAKRRARSLGDTRLYASILINEGRVVGNQGSYQTAITFYEEALRVDPQGKHNYVLLGNLAYAYTRCGTLDEAERLYRYAIKLARQAKDTRIEGSLIGNLSLLLETQGSYDEATDLHHYALTISTSLGDRESEERDLLHRGVLLHHANQYEAAKHAFHQARAIAIDIGDQRGLAYILGNYGRLLFDQGLLDSAEEQFHAARSIANTIGDQYIHGLTLIGLGNSALLRNDTEHALKYAVDAVSMLQACELVVEQVDALRLLTYATIACTDYSRAHHIAQGWLKIASIYEQESACIEAWITLGGIAHKCGLLRHAAWYYAQARRMLAAHPNTVLWGIVQWNRCLLLTARGQYTHAMKALEDSIHAAQITHDSDESHRSAYVSTLKRMQQRCSRRWRRIR